jgi:hypothetical protein
MWGRQRGVNLVDTPELDDFFERLDRMTAEQLLAMRAAWHSITVAEHEKAWAAVRAVGARYAVDKEVGRVRDKAMAWSARGTNEVPFFQNNDIRRLQSRIEAGEAVVDAALAIALGDRLDDQTRDALLGPWTRGNDALD